MIIYRIAQEQCPQEYGYNLTEDKRVAPVNWNCQDVQMCKRWNKAVVKEFLGLPEDAIVYATLADVNDLNPILAEAEDGDEDAYDWSELQSRRSNPPPIVITRKKDGSVVINDGNHRAKFWMDNGKSYIPSWCYDELITDWVRKNPRPAQSHHSLDPHDGDEDDGY